MTQHRSSLPDDKGQPTRPGVDTSMSWGTRRSESESVSRAESRSDGDDTLDSCPSCGSEKTTRVQAANRGSGTAIRRDNPGHKCFACGTQWTVTIGDDHDHNAS